MPRSPLTETVQRVQGMIDYVRENLDDQEYDLFLDLIVPQPELQVEKPKPRKPKKIPHCDACDYTKRHQVHKDSLRSDYHEFQSAQPKSRRTKGIAATLSENLQQGKEAKVDESDDDSYENATCSTCGLAPDANLHHLESAAGYHEFTSGKSHALAAGEGS